MVDVSAEGRCTITPISPTTLTATGGGLPGGTENVRIRCSCTESDGTAVSIVRWYDPAGTRLLSSRNGAFNPNVPHFTRVNGDTGNIVDNTDIILVIPTFIDSYAGTYICGRNVDDFSALTGPTAAIILNISELN